MFVCLHCEGLTVSDRHECGSCGGKTMQRLSCGEHTSVLVEASAAERSLCLPLGSLHGLSCFYFDAVVRLLLEWVSAVLPFSHRISGGAAYSPPFIIDGGVVVWIVESPQWMASDPCDPTMVLYYANEVTKNVLVNVVTSEFFAGLRHALLVYGPCCSRCLRPCAATLQVIGHPTAGSSPTLSVCTYLYPGTPVTQAMAALSETYFEGMALPGVVPTSLRCGRPCRVAVAAAQPDIWPPRTTGGSARVLPPSAALEAIGILGTLSLISINCGGLGEKVSGIFALVNWLEPDIICLQELWEACELDDLELPQFTLFCTGPRQRGGGLATLVHSRILSGEGTHLEELNVPHAQMVRLRWPSGSRISIINLHLCPGISTTGWTTVSQLVAHHLSITGAHLLVVCGDFNEELATHRGRVARSMKASGPWASLFCPTHMVSHRTLLPEKTPSPIARLIICSFIVPRRY